MRACSSPPRPATAARPSSTVAHPVALGHHGGRGHAQPRRQGLGHAGQRHHVHRRVVHRRGRAGPAGRRDDVAASVGAVPADAARCFLGADNGSDVARLDPAKVAGKIVVCDRGGNVLVNKAQAVKEAGGVGMILANTPASTNTITADPARDSDRAHPVHHGRGLRRLKAYAASAGATATIADSDVRLRRPGAVHGLVLVARTAAGRRRRRC